MTFYLTRFDNQSQGVKNVLPGGRFTMGASAQRGIARLFTFFFSGTDKILGDFDESLYTGDVKYANVPEGQQAYWTIPMDCEFPFNRFLLMTP